MDTHIFKEMIAVIRAEEERRVSLLTGEDPDFVYERWGSRIEPFVNELCLMVLVALRHQVERELVKLAARASDDGKEISPKEYHKEVQKLRKGRGRGVRHRSWKLKRIFFCGIVPSVYIR